MNLQQILHAPFTFTVRKEFMPCDTRPLWKSCLLILIIGLTGRANRCSFKKLHVANWVTKNEAHLNEYLEWVEDPAQIRPSVRLDPALDRAIELLVAFGYLEKNNGKIELVEKGIRLFRELNKIDVFQVEKRQILLAKKYLSESMVDNLFKAA